MDLRPPDRPTAVPFDATPYTKQPERSPIPHPNGSQGYVFRAGTEIEKLVGVRQNRAVHGRNTQFKGTSSHRACACTLRPTDQKRAHRDLYINHRKRHTPSDHVSSDQDQ